MLSVWHPSPQSWFGPPSPFGNPGQSPIKHDTKRTYLLLLMGRNLYITQFVKFSDIPPICHHFPGPRLLLCQTFCQSHFIKSKFYLNISSGFENWAKFSDFWWIWKLSQVFQYHANLKPEEKSPSSYSATKYFDKQKHQTFNYKNLALLQLCPL